MGSSSSGSTWPSPVRSDTCSASSRASGSRCSSAGMSQASPTSSMHSLGDRTSNSPWRVSSASASFARSIRGSFAFSFVIVVSSFFGRYPVRIPCHNTRRKAIHKSQRKNLADGGVGSIDGKTPPCFPKSVGAAGRWPVWFSFLIASEFESPQLKKSAFCIFFVLLSSKATNYLKIAFFATFPAEIFE